MGKKVMVVDDEEQAVSIMKKTLEREGFEVYGAHSGKECIESISDISPDVILMDVMMPDMNGWDTIRELINIGALSNVKVIMVTVVKEPPEEHTDLGPYVLDYITKPFKKEKLLESINAVSIL